MNVNYDLILMFFDFSEKYCKKEFYYENKENVYFLYKKIKRLFYHPINIDSFIIFLGINNIDNDSYNNFRKEIIDDNFFNRKSKKVIFKKSPSKTKAIKEKIKKKSIKNKAQINKKDIDPINYEEEFGKQNEVYKKRLRNRRNVNYNF